MGLSLEMAVYCSLIILYQGVCLKLHFLRMMVIPGMRLSHWKIHWEWNSHILLLSKLVMGEYMSLTHMIGHKLRCEIKFLYGSCLSIVGFSYHLRLVEFCLFYELLCH